MLDLLQMALKGKQQQLRGKAKLSVEHIIAEP